jgi:hypothetical protein
VLGAAVAFGIIGMFEAIRQREDERVWEAWDAEDAKQRAEIEARQEEALRRDREAWRYARGNGE